MVGDNMANSYSSWRTGIQIDNIYPVGSIYISTVSTNPGTLFGGTWETFGAGRFLISQNSTYTAGSTGGSSTMAHTHTLAHTHSQVATTSGAPSNNTSGGPSTTNTGSTAITVAQMPYHGHIVALHNQAGTQATAYWYNGATKQNSTGAKVTSVSWVGATFNAAQSGNGDQAGGAQPVGGGGGHTHTLNSHTHTLSSHTHSTSATTTGGASTTTTSAASNTSCMPPYISVYMWKRVN